MGRLIPSLGSWPIATKRNPASEAVVHVLAVPGAYRLVDPADPAPDEDADPYVLAMAQRHREDGWFVRVVTEDRKVKPGGLVSLAAACGLVGIPDVPMEAFLLSNGIWSAPSLSRHPNGTQRRAAQLALVA